jgi:signal transduction histidine kinase
MRISGVFIGWALMSLLPLAPILMGLEFNVEQARDAGVFLWPRKWVARVGFLGIGAIIPMAIDFYMDLSPEGHLFDSFSNRMAMLSGGLLTAISLIVIADTAHISDETFGQYLVCLMMIFGIMFRGRYVGYLTRGRPTSRLKRAVNVCFVATVACFGHRIFNNYCADPTRDAVSLVVEILSHSYLIVVYTTEKKYYSQNKYGLCLDIFGAMSSLVSGSMISPLIIIAIYFNILCGFIFNGRRKRDASHRVEELLASKRSFVRYIAHEMRTPLNVSAIGLQMAMEQLEIRNKSPNGEMFNFPLLSETLEDSSKAIEEAADTLNEMLTFDKIESGKFEIEPERLHVRTIIQSAYKSFFLQAHHKQLTYIIDVPLNMNDVFVMADKKKITQCLRNYISNALKFTPQGGTVTVRAYLLPSKRKHAEGWSAEDVEQTLYVEVVDTGVGIEKHNLKRVFHEVVQFNAAQLQGGGGSGLGLTITKAIMNAHSGTVGAVSEFGSGATFYFEMAAEVDHSYVVEAPQEAEIVGLFEAEFNKQHTSRAPPTQLPKETLQKRVLVVDDSPLTLKMMVRLLQPFAVEILLANNGVEAAKIVTASLLCDKSKHIDMVLTDYHMPEMDGLQLTATLRAAGYTGFIALITGMEAEGSIMTLFNELRGNMILTKPIRTGDITRLILSCSHLGQDGILTLGVSRSPSYSCINKTSTTTTTK